MPRAIVVGAGIGGLASAGALARTGWEVTLFERADRVRPGRGTVTLWPNGIKALHALGLAGGLDTIATPVPAYGLRRPDGQPLVVAGAASGALEVHRADLHDAFIAALGERVDVRTGIEIRSTRAGRPTLSDGRHSYEAELVVGADGAASVIRKRLAPTSRLVSSGFAAWQAFIPWYRAPKVQFTDTLGVGHRFTSATLGDRGVSWTATAPGARRPEPKETQLGLLRRWFAGWHEPVPTLLDATQPDDLVHDPVGEVSPLPSTFASGGYVLVGDAAHAMPHYLGQGACLALEDAATLYSVLSTMPVEAALTAYDRARRPRAVKVMAQTQRVETVLKARGMRTRLTPKVLEKAALVATDWQPPTRREDG
jgi:2-polyprenyl-6-methoxyphenol hydroxylase-like FAD-dependent oxidoreductase